MIPYPTVENDDTRHVKYINILSRVCADIANPVNGSVRLSACVVYKNDIVSFGIAEKKTHPFQARFGKNKDAIFLHAETSAIKNALKYLSLEELENSSLYICRVKFLDSRRKKLVFGMSKPCPGCHRCIETFNIQNVIYTLDNEGYAIL